MSFKTAMFLDWKMSLGIITIGNFNQKLKYLEPISKRYQDLFIKNYIILLKEIK